MMANKSHQRDSGFYLAHQEEGQETDVQPQLLLRRIPIG